MVQSRSSLWVVGLSILGLAIILGLVLVLVLGRGGGDGAESTTPSGGAIPTVQIIAPINGAVIQAGQAIPVNVIANDDEAIARIELYVDNSLIESRVAPAGSALTTLSEQFNWSASMAGPHTLQARAYDGVGQMGASSIVAVEVQIPGAQPTALSSPTPESGNTPTPPLPTVPPASPTPESALVTSNVNSNVRNGPGTNYGVIGGLAEGESALVTGRNAASSWWQISYGGGSGWVANSVVTANAQAFNAPVVSAPPPPPTSTPLPPTAVPTAVAPTNTPAPSTGLWADQTNLTAGQCTTLHWNYTNIRAFYISFGFGYDKEGQPGTGTRQVCPSVTTEYKTTVVRSDGSQESPSLTINVSGAGCGDPYISRFVPTTYDVGAGVPFSIFWDVDCAKSVRFVRVGSTEEPVAGHSSKIDVTINQSTVFQLKVEKNNGGFVYASFTVNIR
jgi:uncharacterized protein YraI